MKKRIFVVEKDDDILQIIERILIDEGYDVFTANTEFGIFEQIKTSRPDAILLDVIHVTPQGMELCRAIKAELDIQHIPVIVPSTHLKAEVTEEVFAGEILSKLFDVDKLLKVVDGQQHA